MYLLVPMSCYKSGLKNWNFLWKPLFEIFSVENPDKKSYA